jgi:hypothetical protein
MRQPWEDLVDADEAYLAQRRAMYEAGIMQSQLRLALATAAGRGVALQVLSDAPVELVAELLDPVFAVSLATHGPLGLAREVLARLDPEWLGPRLRVLVDRRLDAPDPEEPYEDYRRIAELLDSLGQRAILADVVRRAEASDDPDVVEVADDFRTGSGP